MSTLTTEYVTWHSFQERVGYSPTRTSGKTLTPIYKRVTKSKNLNWKEQVERKQNASTPYSLLASKQSVYLRTGAWCKAKVGGIVTEARINSHIRASPLWIVSPSWPATLDPEVASLALGRFLSQIDGLNTPFKALPFLGELKETLQMIKRPFMNFYKGLRHYKLTADKIMRQYKWWRRGKRRISRARIKRWNKSLANAWLEFAFGWSPVLNDVGDAVQAYERFVEQPAVSVAPIWSSASRNVAQATGVASASFLNNYVKVRSSYVRKMVYSCRYVGEYKYSLSPLQGDTRRAMDLCGFNLAAFVPTVWELLPYSWLADYFTNIGQIITSAFTSTQNVAWYCRSSKAEMVQTEKAWPDVPAMKTYFGDDFLSAGGPSGLCELRSLTFVRDVPPLGTPGLVLRVPGLPFQYANMLALLVSKTS